MSKNKKKTNKKATNVKINNATNNVATAELEKPAEEEIVIAADDKAVVKDDDVNTKDKAVDKKKAKKKNANKKPNIFQRMWKSIKGTFSELKKVTWPTWKEVMKSSAVVLVVVFAFFIILFGIDYVLLGILSLIRTGAWVVF